MPAEVINMETKTFRNVLKNKSKLFIVVVNGTRDASKSSVRFPTILASLKTISIIDKTQHTSGSIHHHCTDIWLSKLLYNSELLFHIKPTLDDFVYLSVIKFCVNSDKLMEFPFNKLKYFHPTNSAAFQSYRKKVVKTMRQISFQ